MLLYLDDRRGQWRPLKFVWEGFMNAFFLGGGGGKQVANCYNE
jgi:hypothetical protein